MASSRHARCLRRSTEVAAGLALFLSCLTAPGAAAQDAGPASNPALSTGQGESEAHPYLGGRIYQATAFGNSFMVPTPDGNVIIDTSNARAAERHHAWLTKVSDAPVRYVILTHAHTDHSGGLALWRGPGTHVIAQEKEGEFLDYRARLSGLLATRASAQYTRTGKTAVSHANPGNHAARPLADILFDKEYRFRLGGLTFVCFAAPGETPDMLNVWIPELKALFIGDNYYQSFPNLYTLRGTEPRPALDYVASIDKVLALEPAIVLPSHGVPIEGADTVQRVLTRYRDAILYVHDATVKGMNEGKDVYALMRDVKLPPSLDVGEDYGKIAWSVRGIYDAYIGWFDGDAASMYPASPDEVYAELARLAGGADPVAARAQALIADHRAATALRLTSAALAADPTSKAALEARVAALEALLAASGNTNEKGWLRKGLFDAKAALARPGAGEEP